MEFILLASNNSSFAIILGKTADIAEEKKISVISNSITNIYIINSVKLPLSIYVIAKTPIIRAFIKSRITIAFFLSNQSPKTPAIGDNNKRGRIDIDNIDANIVAEPVKSNTYKDKANCWIL